MNGYLVGPIVGPDRTVDGRIKQPERLRVRGTDPLLIKRTDSIAHRFSVERHSTNRASTMPLVAIDLAGRARRRQLMEERRRSASSNLVHQGRPSSAQTEQSSLSCVTSRSGSVETNHRLSGPRGHFFVRPDSVPLLTIPVRTMGDVQL